MRAAAARSSCVRQGKIASWRLEAMYILLFALPMAGIAGAWLEGHPSMLLRGIEVAPRLRPSHDSGVAIATIHAGLGNAILWLAGAHAIAALYHHFLLKDGVLVSMLPRMIRRRQPR
jgi:cytochrome b561